MMTRKNDRQRPAILRFSIRLLQILLYLPIQIVFIPLALIGLVIGLFMEMRNSRKLGVSFSAGQSLQYRWFMHYFDTRPDPLTIAFVRSFPCESHFGLWSIMGALILSQRLFGFTTRLGKLVEPGKETIDTTAGIRVLHFDRIMEKYVDEVEQIVLPGAGFDLIALRYTKGKQVKVFELDQVNTLNIKVETLNKAGIEHGWITYIPVDYENESWADRLREAGFDRTKKTLFLWQSVSLYLEEDIVRDALKEMAALCTDGSVIAQDFYSRAFMTGEISKLAVRNMDLMARMGEPWRFVIDMSGDPKAAVDSFLTECGLTMTDYIQFGEDLDLEPFYCIVEAEKRS